MGCLINNVELNVDLKTFCIKLNDTAKFKVVLHQKIAMTKETTLLKW